MNLNFAAAVVIIFVVFAVFAKSDDSSPLFLNQLYMISDYSMFENNNEIDSPDWQDETPRKARSW